MFVAWWSSSLLSEKSFAVRLVTGRRFLLCGDLDALRELDAELATARVQRVYRGADGLRDLGGTGTRRFHLNNAIDGLRRETLKILGRPRRGGHRRHSRHRGLVSHPARAFTLRPFVEDSGGPLPAALALLLAIYCCRVALLS